MHLTRQERFSAKKLAEKHGFHEINRPLSNASLSLSVSCHFSHAMYRERGNTITLLQHVHDAIAIQLLTLSLTPKRHA